MKKILHKGDIIQVGRFISPMSCIHVDVFWTLDQKDLYVYYIVCNASYIQNIGPEFCVQGCDIARACEGYITSEDTK